MKCITELKGLSGLPRLIRLAVLVTVGMTVLAVVVCLVGFAVQWLWNATITTIFHTPAITWGQAVLLLVLCKLLFGNDYDVNIKRNHREPTSDGDKDTPIESPTGTGDSQN